jgi:hypothetical protein
MLLAQLLSGFSLIGSPPPPLLVSLSPCIPLSPSLPLSVSPSLFLSSHSAFPLAAASTIHYQLARLQTLTEWWHWLALLLATLAVAAFVIWMYKKDSVELPRGLAILLASLRLFALLGILFTSSASKNALSARSSKTPALSSSSTPVRAWASAIATRAPPLKLR